MSIFKRVRDIVLSDVHEALDKAEKPLSMLNQYIRDMEEQVEKAQDALANQLYLEKKYEILVTEAEAVIAKRTRQAELAVSENEDEMAKLALQEKILTEQKAKMYREQYEITKQQTAVLYEQIDKLKEKYQELQYKKLVLVSRAHAARSIREGQASLASFNTEDAVKGFARVEEYVHKLEAEAAASSYFYQLKYPEQTAFLDYQLQEDVHRELEQLKSNK
jgi:phage shock protein A